MAEMVEGMDRYVNVLKVSTVNVVNLVSTTLIEPLLGGIDSKLLSHLTNLLPVSFHFLSLAPF